MTNVTPYQRYVPFATTQWSLVVSAGRCDDRASRQALEYLCEKYWPALYGYVRRRGHSPEDAHDLTQEFFLQFLRRDLLSRADRQKGRFRSYILTVLKRFLADENAKAQAQKRGGNVHIESLSEVAESLYSASGALTVAPDVQFERDWALALLSSALTGLQQEYADAGKIDLFSVLRNYLVGGTHPQPYLEVAAELGMTEGAVKVAVSRLRQRYRERMRREVAATVAGVEDIESELKHLCRVLAKSC